MSWLPESPTKRTIRLIVLTWNSRVFDAPTRIPFFCFSRRQGGRIETYRLDTNIKNWIRYSELGDSGLKTSWFLIYLRPTVHGVFYTPHFRRCLYRFYHQRKLFFIEWTGKNMNFCIFTIQEWNRWIGILFYCPEKVYWIPKMISIQNYKVW